MTDRASWRRREGACETYSRAGFPFIQKALGRHGGNRLLAFLTRSQMGGLEQGERAHGPADGTAHEVGKSEESWRPTSCECRVLCRRLQSLGGNEEEGQTRGVAGSNLVEVCCCGIGRNPAAQLCLEAGYPARAGACRWRPGWLAEGDVLGRAGKSERGRSTANQPVGSTCTDQGVWAGGRAYVRM